MSIVYLFSFDDFAIGHDDNFTFFINVHNFCDTVWTARVVHVASWTSCHGGVDHNIVVNTEHVDPTVLKRKSYFYVEK